MREGVDLGLTGSSVWRTDSDADPGDVTDRVDPQAVSDAMSALGGAVAEPEEVQSMTLPDILMPESLAVAKTHTPG